jgi:hypothetical protein
MNRKGLLALVLAVLAAGGAFALPEFKMSLGWGVQAEKGIIGDSLIPDWSVSPLWVFFDATYAELSFGWNLGDSKIKPPSGLGLGEFTVGSNSINIGLLGKYPFEFTHTNQFGISYKLLIFPLLGIDYHMTFYEEKEKEERYLDHQGLNYTRTTILVAGFNNLWFKGGVGLDFFSSERVFFRFSALFGIRLPPPETITVITETKNGITVQSEMRHSDRLECSLTAKFAIGFRFRGKKAI